MAVIDDRWAGAGPSDPPRQFDRQPPQDLAAEQSVLGGMLLSKDAIADVVEELSTVDFYKPAHATVYEVILNLFARGEPADVVTVAAELDKAGTLSRIGGAVYLHTLTSAVPTAANAAFYAQIVAEKAVLRRLVEAGTRIVQLGYGGNEGQVGGGEVDEIVDRAQAEIYEVTERRTTEDYVVLEELLQPTMDEMDAIASRGGMSAGVPTGFADLDSLTNGFHPGQMIIMAARPGVGKALALDTPLPTPTGWTTMGEVQVGDLLLGADGKPVPVVAATDVMDGRPCYAVTFSDGEVIVADAEHQWLTWDVKARKAFDYARGHASIAYPENRWGWTSGESSSVKYSRDDRAHIADLKAAGASSQAIAQALGRSSSAIQQQWDSPERAVGVGPRTRTTREIADSVQVRGQTNHGIPVAAPLECAQVDLPLDPWVMGYLLGDGDTSGSGRVACDPRDREWTMKEFDRLGYDVARYADSGHFGVRGISSLWRQLGLDRGKFVPAAYLRASLEQRIGLIQGLVDSDGYVDSHGSFRFTNTNRALVDAFCELVASVGGLSKVHTRERMRAGVPSLKAWDVIVSSDRLLARMPRKAVAARTDWKREQQTRYIVGVAPVASVPVRCVQIDNADHLYLAGRSMVPTHNSTLALDVARNASVKHRLTSVIFSLEMSKTEITMRLLSAEAQIRLSQMRAGTMSEQDWQKIVRRMSEISDAPLFIDDSPNMTMMEIRAKARRLKQRNNLRLIVVDYLQLMSSGKKVESRQQEVSEFSRQMKLLAKELEVPVIAISQLNRGPEQRTDKRPLLSDLRESGSLEQDADMVILVHRPDAFEADDPRAGEADLIIAKHRNGPTTTISVAHQLHYSRFTDLAGQ